MALVDAQGVSKSTKARGRSRRSLAPVGLDLLGNLARHPDGLGITELARSVEVEVAQAHRIVQELVQGGWIAQAKPNGSYRLTGRMLQLAAEQLRHLDLRAASVPVMRQLKRETGETVVLAQFRDSGLFCIAREMPEAPIVAWTQVGDSWPLGSPAAVAVAVEAAVVSTGQEELLPPDYDLTPERRRELDEALVRGWSVDESRYLPGGWAVGAAILDFESRPLGALAIGWPRDRGDADTVERLGQRVRAAADEISSQLGSSSSWAAAPWRSIEEEREEDLFRHLTDLRNRSYEGAVGREETVVRYREACRLLSPVVEDIMGVMSARLLGGLGRVDREETDTESDGMAVSWKLRWPDQELARVKATGAPLEPVTVVGRLRPAHIHGHLGGSYFGDWPMQIGTPADARRQAPLLVSIIEAELHQRVFEAGGAWRLIPAYCERIGEASLATQKEVTDTST